MTRFTPEERADRLVRRRWGFVERSSLLWMFANLGAATRDARRSLFGAFGVHRRPDFSWHWRWLERIGVAYFVDRHWRLHRGRPDLRTTVGLAQMMSTSMATARSTRAATRFEDDAGHRPERTPGQGA